MWLTCCYLIPLFRMNDSDDLRKIKNDSNWAQYVITNLTIHVKIRIVKNKNFRQRVELKVE